MYMAFIFAAILMGYANGSAPIVSYQYGAQNQAELKNLFRKSLVIIGSMDLVMFLLAELCADPVTWIFVGYDPGLHAMTRAVLAGTALVVLVRARFWEKKY